MDMISLVVSGIAIFGITWFFSAPMFRRNLGKFKGNLPSTLDFPKVKLFVLKIVKAILLINNLNSPVELVYNKIIAKQKKRR